jgi:hypothetical protein
VKKLVLENRQISEKEIAMELNIWIGLTHFDRYFEHETRCSTICSKRAEFRATF